MFIGWYVQLWFYEYKGVIYGEVRVSLLIALRECILSMEKME